MSDEQEEPDVQAQLEHFQTLIDRARRQDPDALGELVTRFYPRVEQQVHLSLARDARLGRPWLRARFSTGDVVQEVFRNVIQDLTTFSGTSEEGFCGWLATLVRNRIVDAIRLHEAGRRSGRAESPMLAGAAPLPPSKATDPAAAAMQIEQAELVERALCELDPQTRHLVRARIEGLASFRELAEQLGYGSESGARRAFFEAQSKLALRLAALRAEATRSV
ncbi:MAG: sigma-70 family RNA polymerase sigma factor [Planctomycetaceae bacterium]|nr:sigma-70 family RNA polymerase sigma factor [Planctomycetaceae bacterium]